MAVKDFFRFLTSNMTPREKRLFPPVELLLGGSPVWEKKEEWRQILQVTYTIVEHL